MEINIEKLIEEEEDRRLLELAQQRLKSATEFIWHEDLCAKLGLSPEELAVDCESVEIEL